MLSRIGFLLVTVVAACSDATEESASNITPASNSVQGSSPVAANVRVFPLRYAAADELAEMIVELMDATARGRASASPSALKTKRVDAGVTAVADPKTNSLTVTVSPDHLEDLDMIAELIARLDVDVVKKR